MGIDQTLDHLRPLLIASLRYLVPLRGSAEKQSQASAAIM